MAVDRTMNRPASAPLAGGDSVSTSPAKQPAVSDTRIAGAALTDTVLPARRAAGSADIDALWQSGRYAEVIEAIDKDLGPLRKADLASLDGEALVGWVRTLYLTQQRLIGAHE